MKIFVSILCLIPLALAEPPIEHEHPTPPHQHPLENQRSHDLTESVRNALSTQYKTPEAKSSSAREQKYAPPAAHIRFSQKLSSASPRRFKVSTISGHNQDYSANGILEFKGIPGRSLSQEYEAPMSARTLSTEYGLPDARFAPSQDYGTPIFAKSQQSTPQFSSSQLRSGAAQGSGPSPRNFQTNVASRSSVPSGQYGVPLEDEDHQSLDYAIALEELLNQEPPNYEFAYKIEEEFGSDFGHSESRLGDRAEGSYFVILPDGTKQTVEYEAYEGGFKPRISVEAVGGYDDNAADVTRTAPGPY